MSSYKLPISVKGIVIEDGTVWLRKNERDEWELPGGKMDESEQPDQTVVRELSEELGFRTRPVRIVDAYLYSIQVSPDESRGVLVISYLCELLEKTGEFELEGEAGQAEFQTFRIEELESLNMPEFYKRAIRSAIATA